jgi:hypothetical protein
MVTVIFNAPARGSKPLTQDQWLDHGASSNLRFKGHEEESAIPDLKIGELARRTGTNRRRSDTTSRSGSCLRPAGATAVSGTARSEYGRGKARQVGFGVVGPGNPKSVA